MNKNGLRTFTSHTQDENWAKIIDALQAPKPDFVTMAPPKSQSQFKAFVQALTNKVLPQFAGLKENSASCELKTLGIETLALTGTTTVKLRQTYNQIPVYGSLVILELDENNEPLAIDSSFGEPEDVNPEAQISSADAIAKVKALAGYEKEPLPAIPYLCYYFDASTTNWRLVYVIEDVPLKRKTERSAANPVSLLMDYVIDAHTGDLITELPRMQRIAQPLQDEAEDGLGKQRQIWFMDAGRILLDSMLNVHTKDFQFQDLESNKNNLPFDYVNNLPPASWPRYAVSAHANAAVVAKFLRDVLKRNGINGSGGPLISSINCIIASESPDGVEWGNAAWTGTQIVYGQRRVNGDLHSYAAGLDIVAHEIFHGVTANAVRLDYVAESGALNESYSDIFGIIISNFEEPDLSKWNWEIGRQIPGIGNPLRDFSDPAKYGQPAHMRDYRDLPKYNDNGGVHLNSGIHNLAAYKIMTAKDTHGNYIFTSHALAGLFYVALTTLSQTSLFSNSRRKIDLAALKLFRDDRKDILRAKRQSIFDAFDAVGII